MWIIVYVWVLFYRMLRTVYSVMDFQIGFFHLDYRDNLLEPLLVWLHYPVLLCPLSQVACSCCRRAQGIVFFSNFLAVYKLSLFVPTSSADHLVMVFLFNPSCLPSAKGHLYFLTILTAISLWSPLIVVLLYSFAIAYCISKYDLFYDFIILLKSPAWFISFSVLLLGVLGESWSLLTIICRLRCSIFTFLVRFELAIFSYFSCWLARFNSCVTRFLGQTALFGNCIATTRFSLFPADPPTLSYPLVFNDSLWAVLSLSFSSRDSV